MKTSSTFSFGTSTNSQKCLGQLQAIERAGPKIAAQLDKITVIAILVDKT